MIGRRDLVAAGALLAGALGLGGCQALVSVHTSLDATGSGVVSVGLRLDPEAQTALSRPGVSLSGPSVPRQEPLEQLFPWVGRGGWSAPDGSPGTLSAVRERGGDLVLATEQRFTSVQGLLQILDTRQPTGSLLRAPEASAELPTDLPANVPLLAAARVRVSGATGSTSFSVFGRGGVGEIGGSPCSGRDDRPSRAVDVALGESLAFDYRLQLPGPPARSTADSADGSLAQWRFGYGECPRISANSSAGGSTAVINGVILAGAATILTLILGVRAIRRNRANGRSNLTQVGG